MKRDLPVIMTDKDGYITYELQPTCDTMNIYEKMAHRFIKLLMSDQYGGMLQEIRNNKSSANIALCVANTDKSIKQLSARNQGAVYDIYDGYTIKKLDINKATSSLILEIALIFKGGNTISIVI